MQSDEAAQSAPATTAPMAVNKLEYAGFRAETTALGGGKHRAVIASRGLFAGRKDVDLKDMKLGRYQQNPIVLYEHGRDPSIMYRPVGLTTSITKGADGHLVADFKFNDSTDESIRQVHSMWEKRELRGASIGWARNRDGEPELYEWSLVALPDDPQALSVHSVYARKEGDVSDTSDAKKVEPEPAGLDVDAIIEKLRDGILDHLRTHAAEWLPKPSADADAPQVKENDRGTVTVDKVREDLLIKVAPLLPKGFEVAGTTPREILIAALGDEVPDANARSDGYLEATLDHVLARRNSVQTHSVTAKTQSTPRHGAPVGIMDLIAAKNI